MLSRGKVMKGYNTLKGEGLWCSQGEMLCPKGGGGAVISKGKNK